MNDIAKSELDVAYQILSAELFLGDYSSNRRGAGLQRNLNDYRRGKSVLAGTSVQRYHIGKRKGYCDLVDIPENASLKAGNILGQNIITRLKNPLPHIRIVAHLIQEAEECDFLILDTVNQIDILHEELSPHFVLALFNSKLLNWYVYRFIYAKATLTMHFDTPVTNRIPLPNFTAQPELVEQIVAEVKNIYANRHANEKTSQARIDKYIFQLYGLSPEQIALVEANMP